MEAIKSTSMHVLIIGAVVCSFMYRFTDSAVTMIFATAFTVIVTGRKGRDLINSNKGLYYDKDDSKLKKAE
jgi:hypothetical protein